MYLQLSNWEPGDRAVSEHQRHYPNCRFVRGDRADNVSLAGATSGGGVASQLSSGAAALSNVSNPAMQQSEERLLTFVNWPSRIPVRPDQLAKAGFYYVGTDKLRETEEEHVAAGRSVNITHSHQVAKNTVAVPSNCLLTHLQYNI